MAMKHVPYRWSISATWGCSIIFKYLLYLHENKSNLLKTTSNHLIPGKQHQSSAYQRKTSQSMETRIIQWNEWGKITRKPGIIRILMTRQEAMIWSNHSKTTRKIAWTIKPWRCSSSLSPWKSCHSFLGVHFPLTDTKSMLVMSHMIFLAFSPHIPFPIFNQTLTYQAC